MAYRNIEDQRAACRAHYQSNRSDYTARNARRWEEHRSAIAAYKVALKCIRCGEADPACLDFHHRDETNKTANIGEAGHQGWSWKRTLAEIEKCDVMCANCHRKLHARLRGATATTTTR